MLCTRVNTSHFKFLEKFELIFKRLPLIELIMLYPTKEELQVLKKIQNSVSKYSFEYLLLVGLVMERSYHQCGHPHSRLINKSRKF